MYERVDEFRPARLKRFDGADALCAVEVESHSLHVVRMNTAPP
jgi:hypothetical protein